MMYIQVENAVKRYGKGENAINALDQASLSLEKGEVCVILGPSGSGKSTLLNLLGGLDSADEGTVTVAGCKLSSYNKKELSEYRRHKVGIVFQTYNLIGELTVRENVKVAAEIAPQTLDIDELLDELGLGNHKTHFPAELSGGNSNAAQLRGRS